MHVPAVTMSDLAELGPTPPSSPLPVAEAVPDEANAGAAHDESKTMAVAVLGLGAASVSAGGNIEPAVKSDDVAPVAAFPLTLPAGDATQPPGKTEGAKEINATAVNKEKAAANDVAEAALSLKDFARANPRFSSELEVQISLQLEYVKTSHGGTNSCLFFGYLVASGRLPAKEQGTRCATHRPSHVPSYDPLVCACSVKPET